MSSSDKRKREELDKDIALSEAALRRAAIKARELARKRTAILLFTVMEKSLRKSLIKTLSDGVRA